MTDRHKSATSSGEVFALLRGIDEDIDTYLALTQPDEPEQVLREVHRRDRRVDGVRPSLSK